MQPLYPFTHQKTGFLDQILRVILFTFSALSWCDNTAARHSIYSTSQANLRINSSLEGIIVTGIGFSPIEESGQILIIIKYQLVKILYKTYNVLIIRPLFLTEPRFLFQIFIVTGALFFKSSNVKR
jgi:hypothetical protein